MLRFILTLMALFIPASFTRADFFLKDGQRVVFLGDSNTFAGHFIAYLDAYLFTRHPEKIELLNLGLPSETVSGLSEPDHPYPRPCVHERLDRVLKKTKPNVIVVCYGMNDGIYYPFSEERLKKYQEGMLTLIDKVEKAGAKVVLMTPCPFDPKPLAGKTLPANAEKFSWMRPYEKYDEVLRKYSDWLLTLREKGYLVVDAHAAVRDYIISVRKKKPDAVVSRDGIHPDVIGHWVVAQTLLEAWRAPDEVVEAILDFPGGKIRAGKLEFVNVVDEKAGFVRFAWWLRSSMPLDPAWDGGGLDSVRIADRLNRHRLVVAGLPRKGKYEVFVGEDKVGEFTRDELLEGVRVTVTQHRWPDGKMLEMIKERQEVLGRAWLSDVGHRRPDTPKGLPLSDAQARAKKLEEAARAYSCPKSRTVRIIPLKP